MKRDNFLLWEPIFLPCDTVTGETIFGIRYIYPPKVTMTLRGRDSYTAWRFHIYGCPKRTSQTSSGTTSHSTLSLKGLMQFGRRHCWVMWIPLPWLIQPILYGCGCGVVGFSNILMTFVEIGFFLLSLSTTKCSGIPFTLIYEWKRWSSTYDSLSLCG